jgi:hypothetical protein
MPLTSSLSSLLITCPYHLSLSSLSLKCLVEISYLSFSKTQEAISTYDVSLSASFSIKLGNYDINIQYNLCRVCVLRGFVCMITELQETKNIMAK